MILRWWFPQPGKLVSINDTAGRTWQATRGPKQTWEEAGWAHGNRVKQDLHSLEIATPLADAAMIKFDFSVPDKRRRDGHNYAGTICKWFIDGLVIAKVFLDDDYQHLHLDDASFNVEPRPESKQRLMRLSLFIGGDPLEKDFGP
jgi:hypothetical protein